MGEWNELKRPPRQTVAELRQSVDTPHSTSGPAGPVGVGRREMPGARGFVRRHPYVALGSAVAAGLLLSGMLRPRRAPADRLAGALADAVEDVAATARRSLRRAVIKAAGPGVVQRALVAVLVTGVIDYLRYRGAAEPPRAEQSFGLREDTAARSTPVV